MNSPTLTTRATQLGMILGTAAYMAPEQAKGKAVDKRADIWAFGVVLYEMLTARRAFAGDDVSTTLAAVLMKDPEWGALPADTPAPLAKLTGAASNGIRGNVFATSARRGSCCRMPTRFGQRQDQRRTCRTPQNRRPRRRDRCGGRDHHLGCLRRWWVSNGSEPRRSSGSSLHCAAGQAQSGHRASRCRRTDGALRLRLGTTARVSCRSGYGDLADGTPTRLPGTEGGTNPFWSPDSRFIAFFTQDKLKKIDLASARAQTLCDALLPPIPGASWSINGDILFVATGGMLFRVAATGGTPIPVLTAPGEPHGGYGRPQFLPDGQRFLFYLDSPDQQKRGMLIGALDRAERTRLTGVRATFSPPDQLLLNHQRDGLLAQRFDLNRFELSGEPRVLFDDAPQFLSVSDNGVLVYRRVQSLGDQQMELRDRQGKRLATIGVPGDLFMPRFSPDGKRLALERHNGRGFGDLEIVDLARDAVTRFTFNPTHHNAAPTWSPTGDRVAFHVSTGIAGRGTELFVKPANGLTPQQVVLPDASPTDWTAGDVVVFERAATGQNDLWQLSLDGKQEPVALLSSPANEPTDASRPMDDGWRTCLTNQVSARFMSPVSRLRVPSGRYHRPGAKCPSGGGTARSCFSCPATAR